MGLKTLNGIWIVTLIESSVYGHPSFERRELAFDRESA